MNLVSAVCPSCGAQIQIPPDQDRAFCSYCGNQIVVKTEIADKVKIDGVVKIQSADFIIEAGALKEYHGAGTDVVIPDNVTNISGAFRKTSITTITLPEELQVLSGAFDSCSSLRAVNCPKGFRTSPTPFSDASRSNLSRFPTDSRTERIFRLFRPRTRNHTERNRHDRRQRS